MGGLTHVTGDGKAAMVDVSAKTPQRRRARAQGRIELAPETVRLVRDNSIKKGDVLAVARIAGIQAAKQTAGLIPLCHPLPLDHVDVKAQITDTGVTVTCEAVCTGRTGVEMEALTGVSVALLAVYDMCKAVDKGMRITETRLLEKVKENVQ